MTILLVLAFTLTFTSFPEFGCSAAQSPVCPGDIITYNCSTSSPGTQHVWRGTAFSGQCSTNNPSDEISVTTLSAATDEVGESISCGVFTATVTSNTSGVSSELTFTASIDLDEQTVVCAGGDYVTTTIKVFTPPVFPDNVVQNRSLDMQDRTTVIDWEPATVSSGGVTYDTSVSVMTDNVTFMVLIADNTQTNANVTVPQFNVPYNVCIEAFNDCGNSSGTPRCTTVTIEAEAVVVSDLSFGLTCSMVIANGESLLARGATVMWIADDNRNGNKLRPPVTMAILSCEQEMVQVLPPSATEFMFTSTDHPNCFNSSQAKFNLGLINAGGPAMKRETLSLSVIDFPAILSRDSTIFMLDDKCSENPLDFSIRIRYNGKSGFTTVESQYDDDISGFEVTFHELSEDVMEIEYELIMFYRGIEIGRVSIVPETQESVDISFVVTVSIFSLIVVALIIVLVATNTAWYYQYCYRKVISRTVVTSDIEMQAPTAEGVPMYEDVSELPQSTGHEIFTEENKAYGPMKSRPN